MVSCTRFLNYIRRRVTKLPIWRILVGLFFTFLRDAAGLFSASTTIGETVTLFHDPTLNIVVVVGFMLFVDTGSEIWLILVHDIPLCQRKKLRPWLVRVGLVGQILTSMSWFALMIVTFMNTIVNRCNTQQIINLECDSLWTGISSTMVVFMVFLKNSMTLKEYKDRAFIYPVICSEDLLFLYHMMRDDRKKIIEDFKTANGMNEPNWEAGCMDDPTFNLLIDVGLMVALDVAALTSVYLLIVHPGDAMVTTFFKALPFVIMILLDIISEVAILLTHDIPICNQEEDDIQKNIVIFQASRIIQVLVQVGWIITFSYMVYIVATLQCTDKCACMLQDEATNCSSSFCPSHTCTTPFCSFEQSGLCLHNNFTNFTWTLDPSLINPNFTSFNCSRVYSTKQCQNDHPSMIGCVLLGLVLLENLYQLVGMFFRSYILPITVPPALVYYMFITTDEHDKMFEKIGKNEFGADWDLSQIGEVVKESEALIQEDSLF
eukprot:TRINITY_DN2652_c0_g1_i1.p1 TRINITY_DN2652_c0_g1~~TRINITY_DN2652_c0_g1_i1.p1  ORF type:complete len:490 (+),score=79.15 TRINITY_DN2652_c0_g1_i1:99-1568(+)